MMFSSQHHILDDLNVLLYPDLEEAGGLGQAFATVMDKVNQSIYITKPYRPAWANACGSNGSVHLTLLQGTRGFVNEIRRAGLSVGRIQVEGLRESSDIFDKWLSSEMKWQEIVKAYSQAQIRPKIELFEELPREELIWNWSLYLNGPYLDLLYLVHASKELAGALPNYSYRTLFFEDGPFEKKRSPLISEEDGIYRIHDPETGQMGILMNAFETYSYLLHYIK